MLALSINIHAQEMKMTDTNGTSYKVIGSDSELKIEGMEGKIVFLQLFGLNCPACKKEIPHLINIQNKYPDKVKIMAIEVQNHEVDPINAFKKEYGINYTTFSNYDIGYMVRFIVDKSGWDGPIPFMVAIDAKGQVKFTRKGMVTEKELEEYIAKFSK